VLLYNMSVAGVRVVEFGLSGQPMAVYDILSGIEVSLCGTDICCFCLAICLDYSV